MGIFSSWRGREPELGTAKTDAHDFVIFRALRSRQLIIPPRLRGPFTIRYAIALLVIAILSCTAYLAVTQLVDTEQSAAAVVNVAGRQRMLSQRIALEAGLLPGSTGATHAALAASMTSDVNTMAASQRGLLDGDPTKDLPGHPSAGVLALFQGGTQASVDNFVAAARRILNAPTLAADDLDIRLLQGQSLGPLLPALDRIVQAYQTESEQRIATIKRWEQLILSITLLTLCVEALFVFRPMNRRIQREKVRLSEASDRHQAVSARHAFTLRLRDAFDLADTEDDLVVTVLQAIEAGGVPGEPDMLLEQEGGALVPAAASGTHRCTVTTLDGCPALRRGRTMSFPDARELGACSQLRRDNDARNAASGEHDGSVASICAPVTFLGRGIGVVRTVTEPGHPVADQVRETLESVASAAGTHIGTLRAFAQTRSDADRDVLTGLLNRRGLDHAVSRLEAQRSPYVVVIADLDHFKAVNDTYGHDVGDTVLVAATRAMSSVLRPGDILARHGGEEFTIVLPLSGEGLLDGNGLAAGVAVAQRIRGAVANAGDGKGGPSCTVSMGVTGPITSNLGAALRQADTALYRAKSLGRNRVEVFEDQAVDVFDEQIVGVLDDRDQDIPAWSAGQVPSLSLTPKL